jgi:hypothetical protein
MQKSLELRIRHVADVVIQGVDQSISGVDGDRTERRKGVAPAGTVSTFKRTMLTTEPGLCNVPC